MNNKVIFTSNKEVAIVIDIIKTPFLDEMMLRFPHIVQDIFQELDDKSLTNCRNVSKACCDFIDNEKFYLVRKIQNCVSMNEFQQQWKKVLRNIPTESTKKIFVAVEQFVENDLNRKKLQWSPLHIAAEQGNLEFCKYIIEKTKEHNPKRQDGITAFHMATHNGCQEICKLIFDNLEDKNPADNKGITPFHTASKKGHFDVCKLIIQNIDNKNPAAHDGCTPLHLATDHGHLEIVRIIVETGVDKSPLFEGKTPLKLVRPRSCYRFYKLLCDNNSQIWQRIFCDIALSLFLVYISYVCVFFVWMLFELLYCGVALKSTCPMQDSVIPITYLIPIHIIFPLTFTIDLFLLAMIWLYLSGCIHKYNFCFAPLIANFYK